MRYWVKKSSFVNLDNIEEVRVFILSLFNISDFDMCLMLRKKMCFWHTLLRSPCDHNPRELRARSFPHNKHIHTFMKIYIASRREHRAKRRKRGCKAYPCRSLWRRVAITGSFIHCTPLTSSLGRSFTLLPSPGITRQPLPTTPRSSTTLHTPFRPATASTPISMTSLCRPSNEGWVLPLLSCERGNDRVGMMSGERTKTMA